MRKPSIIVATVDGAKVKIEAYKAVLSYLERLCDDEESSCKALLFAILRQSVVDIAVCREPPDILSAMSFLKGADGRRVCDTLGLNHTVMVEVVWKFMADDIQAATEIVNRPSNLAVVVEPEVELPRSPAIYSQQLCFDGF